MHFKFVSPEELYNKDPNLKKVDVIVLQEWLKKQPHLPQITEIQILIFLHGSNYRIEPTKTAIDNYFTVKTHCSDIFNSLPKELVRKTLSVGFMNILPERTPEGYVVFFMKIVDSNTDNFNFTNMIACFNMICTLHMHQYGFEQGAVIIVDLKGFNLSHMLRLNLMGLKKMIYLLQEGAPIELKGLHVINVVPFIEKLLALVKPMMKTEIYNMKNLHTKSIDSLYQFVPKKCLPGDYGGDAPAIQDLNEINIKNMEDNFDFFAWHDAQKVDESQRFGKPKNIDTIFGAEGTFKKLEID